MADTDIADMAGTAGTADTAKTEGGAGKTGVRQGRGLTVPSNPAMALRRLNAQHGTSQHAGQEETGPDKPTDKQTEQQAAKQTNNTTNLQDSMEGASEVEVEAVPQAATPPPQPEGSPTSRKTNSARNKQTEKQTNNTTRRNQLAAGVADLPAGKRDGRTQRIRQNLAGAEATVVTSFRILATTMEELDEFCFRNRMRKQDVVQQALEAFLADEADGSDDGEGS